MGQPQSVPGEVRIDTTGESLETSFEVNGNLFFAPDFLDDGSLGALFKMTAGVGVSNQTGGYINFGLSMSWASVLLLTVGLLSGG